MITPHTTLLKPLHGRDVRLTSGILAERCQANFENLFQPIEARDYFEEVYGKTHDRWYAEPEFCGHYLDAAMAYYEATGDEGLREMAQELVDTILRHQRESGYLGVKPEGEEFGRTFEVWNQQFTIMGLMAFYEQTGYEPALQGAAKGGEFVARHFLDEGGRSLFHCVNAGIQHSCSFIEFVRLLRHTGKPVYRDFLELLMRRWSETNLDLLSIDHPDIMPTFDLGCQKGIEMLVVFQGIADYYRLTGDERYLSACEAYWFHLQDWHIGLTGNGTVGENWNPAKKNFRHVSTDILPNENCVAVGWMMFSAQLFELTGKRRYLDAFERTLYNHLIGAQARDGSDFSYYQGTFGCKLHAKKTGEYSCCRFRGLRMLAKLPRYVAFTDERGLTLNLYTPAQVKAEVAGQPIEVAVETAYPRFGSVKISIGVKQGGRFALRLRRPEWCPVIEMRIDGQSIAPVEEEGFLLLDREWGEGRTEIELRLDMAFRENRETVNHRPAAALEYGPLVLALDDRFHDIENARLTLPARVSEDFGVEKPRSAGDPLVELSVPGQIGSAAAMLHYIDYATAGSVHPGKDRFTVWLSTIQGAEAPA